MHSCHILCWSTTCYICRPLNLLFTILHTHREYLVYSEVIMGMYFFCSLLILQTLNSRGRGESSSDGSSNGPDLSGSSRVDASASSDDKEYYKYECYDPITYTNLLLNISCAGTPKDPCPTDISYKFLLDDADAALQKTMSLGSEMNQTCMSSVTMNISTY